MKYFAAMVFVCAASIATLAHAHASKRVFHPAHAEQTAFGKAGDPKRPTRIMRIAMDDSMRFTPNVITVKQGETVKLQVTNRGELLHEMVIGTPQELQQHAAMMKKLPDIEHDDLHMAHVKSGKSASLVWIFNRPGEFDFAYLIAGHFESGMAGKIKVIGKEAFGSKT